MIEWWKIFTKDGCPWCVMAKELLQVHGIDYHEVNTTKFPDVREELKRKGFKTVPIIYKEDILIGGYQALDEYFKLKGMK